MKTRKLFYLVLVIIAMISLITACAQGTRGICSFCEERKIIVEEEQFMGLTLRICQDCIDEFEAPAGGLQERTANATPPPPPPPPGTRPQERTAAVAPEPYEPEEVQLIDIDIFEDIEILYEGLAPRARAVVRNNSNNEFVRGIRFNIANNSNLTNGNAITVTANITSEQAERSGYRVIDTEKTFIVSGVDAYVYDYTMLTDEANEFFRNAAHEMVLHELNLYLLEDGVSEDSSVRPRQRTPSQHFSTRMVTAFSDRRQNSCTWLLGFGVEPTETVVHLSPINLNRTMRPFCSIHYVFDVDLLSTYRLGAMLATRYDQELSGIAVFSVRDPVMHHDGTFSFREIVFYGAYRNIADYRGALNAERNAFVVTEIN